LENFTLPLHPVLVFLVVLARIGGLVTFAPFWSHNAANPKIRIILAMVLAVLMTPIVSSQIQTPPSETMALAAILISEILIGMLLGFVGKLVFLAFEIAAFFLASQMGFSLAGTIDPSTQAHTTAFGTIAQMMALMVLLGADGHYWFLGAAIKSFSVVAPGEFVFSGQMLDVLLRLSATALTVGVTLAAPAIIVLLAVEFALEFFGKTAPQFQMFILGFPIKIGVGLWLIGGSLYFLPNAMRDVLSNIYQGLTQILGTM
jgi:flagellar biosynthesis protein FliR